MEDNNLQPICTVQNGKRLARELAISTNNETTQQTLFECSTLNGKL